MVSGRLIALAALATGPALADEYRVRSDPLDPRVEYAEVEANGARLNCGTCLDAGHQVDAVLPRGITGSTTVRARGCKLGPLECSAWSTTQAELGEPGAIEGLRIEVVISLPVN